MAIPGEECFGLKKKVAWNLHMNEKEEERDESKRGTDLYGLLYHIGHAACCMFAGYGFRGSKKECKKRIHQTEETYGNGR